jgi:cyclase
MLKHRLIPVLLLKNGLLVRSELFKVHQIIGNPIHEVERFNEWKVDELIYLDISRTSNYDLRREDVRVRGLSGPLDILDAVSLTCFMPLTWGGRIRTLDDMRERLRRGADKIAINTAAIEDPSFVTRAAEEFGSQAIVVSIDAVRTDDGGYDVRTHGGSSSAGRDPAEWASEAAAHGAGEILLQAIHRDGTGEGYDVELIGRVARAVRCPVVACGGAGTFEDYAVAVKAGASAVAAANLWHFKELADRAGKRAMAKANISVRL